MPAMAAQRIMAYRVAGVGVVVAPAVVHGEPGPAPLQHPAVHHKPLLVDGLTYYLQGGAQDVAGSCRPDSQRNRSR